MRMVRFTFSGRRAWRRGRFNLAVRARPYVGLVGGYLALFAASYGWNTSATWADAAFFALSAWLAMRVVAVAARSIAESSSRIIFPSSVQRWLTARLESARDLHYAAGAAPKRIDTGDLVAPRLRADRQIKPI
jgi:hypothetical protein